MLLRSLPKYVISTVIRCMFLLFLTTVGKGNGINAQSLSPGSFSLQKLDNRYGLSNSAVNYLFRDSDNVLWIATWDGLNMYDGSTFHVFNLNRSAGAGNNVIRYITEDRKNNIWITTIEGVSRYQKDQGKFYNYFYDQNQRSSISEQEFQMAVDNSGRVYCLTQRQGLMAYDPTRDSFLVAEISRHPSRVNKLLFDSDNHLWILNNSGSLEEYIVNESSVRLVKNWENLNASGLFLSNNRLFVTNAGMELFEIFKQEGSTRKVTNLPSQPTAIAYFNQHYLFAWASRGFSVYDENLKEDDFLRPEVNQMANIRITSWASGSQQILWFGTDGNGVIKIYPATKPFGAVTTSDNITPYNRPVRSFIEVNGNLWVGTKGGGIIEIPDFMASPAVSSKRNFLTAPSVLDNNSVYVMKRGADDLVYIGTDGKGLGIYNSSTRRFYKWQDVKGHGEYPEFGSVYAILPEKDSSLWIGTSGYGLIHLKILFNKSGSPELKFLERFTFTNDDTGPANDIIYALADGGPDKLWIGCRYGGLSMLNKKPRRFTTYKAFAYEGSLSNNDVLSLYPDSRGRLWVGTSYGLNFASEKDLNGETPRFRKLTTAEGLPNNTIHAIEEDADGSLWVSTNKGVAKVSPDANSVTYYQQIDGLQNNEFCDGAVWKSPEGYLFMGTIDGFNYFLPRNIRNSDWLPNLLVLNRRIGGDQMLSYSVLKPNTNTNTTYVLDRKDGYFEMDVKAISYLNAEKCEYAYILEGYDKIWHSPGTSGKLLYTNLPPGNYRLKIRWSNGEGTWTSDTQLLSLRVKQYTWLTTPAILCYALFLFWILYTIYKYRQNRAKIRQELELEHRMRLREEELHQQRIGFFTNIAHELQTPLTLIMGSAERLHEQGSPYFMKLIHQQASRLTYLIQQLLEFRKAESGLPAVQYSTLNISELLSNLAAPFHLLAVQQGKSYHRSIASGISGATDKDKIEKVVFNLLSNAFKHSFRNADIRFTAYQESDNTLTIKVSNTGSELEPHQVERLFTTFYVAPEKGARTEKFGTGIGLAFTRQLVTMLGGEIRVNTGNGYVEFEVKLPILMEHELRTEPAATEKPSYLFSSITSYDNIPPETVPEEQNKQAILDTVEEPERKTILIVEDEPEIRFLLRDILKNDYVIFEAENGREALDFVRKTLPDLIISDVMMPEMDGLEFCHHIKDTPSTCQIPFILLSARGSIEHKTEGYEVGADAYVAKPFHTSHLLVRVRKLLEYRERLSEIFRNSATIDLGNAEIPDTDREFIDRLVKVIEENIDDVELGSTILEKELSMSRMQLYRKVKTVSGMTPGEFIRNIRLRRAAQLLTSTNLTVSEIFYRTGFNNQSYFFREFKKHFNCAPNEYRARQTARP